MIAVFDFPPAFNATMNLGTRLVNVGRLVGAVDCASVQTRKMALVVGIELDFADATLEQNDDVIAHGTHAGSVHTAGRSVPLVSKVGNGFMWSTYGRHARC
jgi:hypothetical protein